MRKKGHLADRRGEIAESLNGRRVQKEKNSIEPGRSWNPAKLIGAGYQHLVGRAIKKIYLAKEKPV